ncbi:DNA repair exonuclease [Candidatus Bathyarchaeota archaeon]|nr:DNA repair exonuclease [Candidatus Bathyarchaeota archaeon]MBT4423592.1 DNA repair exonuclease [Candidatus Bathyarchaeota archaeon]MBT6603643.1 DNA repair exonuclease [Candidatus Bathyarchaeota archaeon]MBT7186573.1 DNA repair exonuclease [Candidatus Bathyarchaeota archaeon]MBT7345982.1 DNA repair exonuclease [Candidatus Bathyarchaeota archaeon]
MIRIVITGDNHLNLYSQKLGSRLSERRSRIGQTWWKTVQYAIDNKVDIYINTGDLFDQLSPRNPPRATVIDAFRLLKEAGVQSFIIAGNHEAPRSEKEGVSPHVLLKRAKLARVFENRLEFEQDILEIQEKKISISGMSFNRNLTSREDPLEDKVIPNGADLNIAVLHYSIEGIAPPIWEEPSIKLSSIEANGDIQLFAMGHIHEHTEKKVNDSLIVYPGGTERYNFGESDKTTGFILAEYDEELEIKYIPVDSQPMKQVKLHTSNMDHGEINGSIRKVITENSAEDSLFQLVLEGSIPFQLYREIEFTSIHTHGRALNFYFEYVDRITPKGEGLEFTQSEGLSPRKLLEETSMEAVSKSKGTEQKLWQQAMEYALSYYMKERE